MSHVQKILTAIERSEKALTLRPAFGQRTAVTRVRVRAGLACDIEDGRWKLTVDRAVPYGYAL